MKIESTDFGRITINGKTYSHDVIIHLSGKIAKRKKKLSTKEFGTSHLISKNEIKAIYEKGATQLVVGTGQYGHLKLSPEAADYLQRRGCHLFAEPTFEAIDSYNRSNEQKIGLFHVNC